MSVKGHGREVLVHLAAGVGNIVLATPLLVALDAAGFAVDVLLDADYPPTAELLGGWSVVRRVYGEGARRSAHLFDRYDALAPAVPPFYWPRFARLYPRGARTLRRPPDQLFYRDEQAYYLAFADALGAGGGPRPVYRLPVAASDEFGTGPRTLALAPGCKGGEMGAKRWPYFAALAALFDDVAVVGTAEDLRRDDGTSIEFPAHARLFIDRLSLRETARLLASCGAVVANDSGLAHVAAAVGTPVVMIFGPTPDGTLGPLAPNVAVVRAGLACEPCWFGPRLRACGRRLDCLREISVERVGREARRLLGREDAARRSFTETVLEL
ncbi:MAG: glycosyltransferase family 9 protein [Acidobacteria bacterium]|nr:glycosyltransferase family 9 protein [Acidobacteriota bacterium]